MIVFVVGFATGVLLAALCAAWFAWHQAMKARDSALRAGIAVVVARQSAKQAEAAVGLVAWPERKV